MKIMPIPTQAVSKRLNNFSEVELGFSKRIAVEEARRFPQSNISSSQPKCPLGVNILEFVRLLREGDVHEAYKKIREENCLPAVCGRLCPAPCEEECVVGGKKMPLDVRTLERFAGDHGRPKFLGREKLTCAKEPVAVIGSGPAGLSAAAFLARELYCVSVYESLPLLGGVLRYGVPEFRLAKNVLEAEIGQIRDLGVEFITGTTLGENAAGALSARGAAAVVLAVGKSHPALSSIPGTDAQGVFYAQEVLMKLNFSHDAALREFSNKMGQNVVVIGSRSMALDCARACRRMKKKACVVFPGMEEEIGAHRHDIRCSREEGVEIQALMKPLAVEVDGSGRVKGLRCLRMDFAEKHGQWVLTPVPGSENVLAADTVILASGSDVSPRIRRMFPEMKFNKDGTVWLDDATGQTSVPGVFAAGDLVDARGRILDAMISGKWAAEQVMQFLKNGGRRR